MCVNNHNACLKCLDGFRSNDIQQCPFCREPINLKNPLPNLSLMRDLEKYEREEKNFVAGMGMSPTMKTQDELVNETY